MALNKKKLFKRLALGFFGFLALLILAAVAIPYFFKDEIVARVKSEINKQVDAEVDFADVHLSLFRSFPDFSLGLDSFRVSGKGAFEGLDLARIERFDLTLDLMSVIKMSERPIEVQSIALRRPVLHVLVLRNGQANYDIAKPSSDSTASSSEGEATAFQLQLKSYAIEDGHLIYDDRSMGAYVEAKGLQHSGRGDLTATLYELATATRIEALTARYGGIAYLSKAKTEADITLAADMAAMRFTLKDSRLTVNALSIGAEGWLAMPGEDIDMDLAFKAPDADFRHILSLVPGAYIEGYEAVTVSGKGHFDAFVKGRYNAASLPAFGLKAGVENGAFKYPDLPLGVSKIFAQIDVNSPSSNLDDLTLDIRRLRLELGGNPFEADMALRRPMSDPELRLLSKGRLDFAQVQQAFPLEGVERLQGLIDADLVLNTRMSYVEQAKYDQIDTKGDFRVQGLFYKASDMPEVNIKDLQLSFTPRYVEVANFEALLGRSDLQASGRVDNILAYITPGQTLKGQLQVRSKLFDANEWMAGESAGSATASVPEDTTSAAGAVFDRFDFDVDGAFQRIEYADYVLENTVAKGHFTAQEARLGEFSTQIGESDIRASGTLQNMFGYLFGNETLRGDINLKSQRLNVNQLMGYVPSEPVADASGAPTEAAANADDPVLVPDNVDVRIVADAGEIIYDNMELKRVSGELRVRDQQVRFSDLKANTLGGNIVLAGGYDSRDAAQPRFDFSYRLAGFDFGKTFSTFNSFQVLAPIGQYLDGKFNSEFKMSGLLGKGMMPDYNSISASGLIETLNAVVNSFKPLEAVGQKLNVDYFNSLSLRNTVNFFEIKDGKIAIQPFDIKYQDMSMTVGGTHSITQSIDYVVDMAVPKAKLTSNAVGAAADQGWNFLRQQASSIGLNISDAKTVNVRLRLGGTLTKPTVQVLAVTPDGQSLEEVAGSQVEAIKEQVLDTAKALVQQQVDKAKDKAEQAAAQAIDTARAVVQDKVNEAVDKAKDRVESEVKDKASQAVKDKAEEVLGDKAKEVEDKAKEQLDKWNPFGKGKKKDE